MTVNLPVSISINNYYTDKTNFMRFSKYIVNPYLMEDEEEQEPKEEKQEPMGGFMMKKMEKLFFEKRAVYLWGVVDDKSAKDVVTKLLLLDADKPGEEIKFYINSPGGVVTSGMVIYDTMKLIQSPVSTICMGLAASMGSILLSAGTRGKRYVYPHGEIMIHQPSLGGYFQATSADIEIQANQIRKTKELGAKILAENCGKPVEQVMADFDRDYWMDAQEAVAYSIVDAVLGKI
jgi:ATP-dependent Clp protease protease subunit